MNKQRRGFTGFTIIEVVLVLAIAGLIMLMALVVFPQAQIAQRDSQRRTDMSTVLTAVVNYQNNNNTKRNNLPGEGTTSTWNSKSSGGTFNCGTGADDSACRFVRDYLNSSANGTPTSSTFNDPDGIPYSLVITTNYADSGAISCNGITDTTTSSNCPISSDGGVLNADFKSRAIYLIPGATCNGEEIAKSTTRHFAIMYKLEGTGVICIDDQRTASNS